MLEFEGQVAKKFLNGIYVIQKYKSTNRYLYLFCHHVWSVKIEETISLFNLLLVISGPCWLLLLRHNRLITTKPKKYKAAVCIGNQISFLYYIYQKAYCFLNFDLFNLFLVRHNRFITIFPHWPMDITL